MSVHVLDELHDLAVERRLVTLAAAVAVKLDVRQVAAGVAERLHRLERRPPVAGHAEIVAVEVDRVRQPHARRPRARSVR